MNESLNEYNKKRNFLRTNEPKGTCKRKNKIQHQFVVQYHEARKKHYDFRLEWEGVLLSWAIIKGPSYCVDDKRLAVQVEDHPLDYANFEGSIPKGEYGGGWVMIFDYGTYQVDDMKQSLQDGLIQFILHGKRLKGKWRLVRLKDKEKNWLFIKEKDKYCLQSSGIETYKTSVVSHRSMEQIKNEKKNPFHHVHVKLAKSVKQLPKKDYIYEIKHDGYRTVAYIENGNVELKSRNQLSFNEVFSSILPSLKILAKKKSMILDGEMVILDEQGRSNFSMLQEYVHGNHSKQLVYIVFDLLALDGNDLRKQDLLVRKKKLKELMKDSPQNLLYSQHIQNHLDDFIKLAQKINVEGIVAKRIHSSYNGLRNEDWLKLKFRHQDVFMVGGYKEDRMKKIQSLLLGVQGNKTLSYVGKVGTGIQKKDSEELQAQFLRLIQKQNPFVNFQDKKTKYRFIKPKIAVVIEYAEWSKNHQLRQASYKGIQIAQSFQNVQEEQKEFHLIQLTNPNRVIFSKLNITKQDVFQYYQIMAKKMLPYLINRCVSIVYCHQDIAKKCFFRRHPQGKKNQQSSVTINGKEYVYIKNEEDILQAIQDGAIEFHLWGSQIEKIDHPNWMVFDLDPDEKVQIKQIRQGVRDLKKILSQLSLKAYLKTSGGKGYHLVVPFTDCSSWDEFKDFAKKIAQYMEQKWPNRYTSNSSKKNRKNKIFIDWLRNTKGATSVAPYSLRIRENASVSMPIAWKDLDKIKPDEINLYEALKRMKTTSPWKNFFHTQNHFKKQ